MQGLLNYLQQLPAAQGVAGALGAGARAVTVYGVAGTQASYLAAALAHPARPVCVVTPGEKEAGEIAQDLRTLLAGRGVFLLVPWEIIPVRVVAYSRHIVNARLVALQGLASAPSPVVVASVEALARRLVPVTVLRRGREIREGEDHDPEALARELVELGYEPVAQVEVPGQFSRRGGILDVFPPTNQEPCRLEFFGDEVVSLRTFDPATQRSVGRAAGVSIVPAREMLLTPERWEEGEGRLAAAFTAQERRLEGEARRRLRALRETVLSHVAARSYFPGCEEFLAYFYPEAVTLFDYFPPETPVLLCEPARIQEVAAVMAAQRAESYTTFVRDGEALPGQFEAFVDWPALAARIERQPRVITSFAAPAGGGIPGRTLPFEGRSLAGVHGRPEALAEDVRRWKRKGYAVVLFAGTPERGARVLDVLREDGVEAYFRHEIDTLAPGDVVVCDGGITSGCEFPGIRLALAGEREIFGGRVLPRRHLRRAGPRTLEELDLRQGDYVVHIQHGIGRYRGIVPLEIEGVRREYLLLEYAGDDRLYVPVDQLGLVQKYVGAEGETPRLSRLGSGEWARTRRRVREAVREVARDLLNLYAARQSRPGHAFSPDGPWQQDFEAAFPYEETPDQLRAVAEIKADMEKPRPMDRLLCGDVGYGKTEVAMRAAFKAVMDGKQVALLVPTTVLAQQHYLTFTRRFSGYPVKIEMLSRFKSPAEQKRIVKALARGTVDIVIGTHRLISDDVRFANLGLLIIDEEQRFGVVHKEKLKLAYPEVDVLTLSATPIPRTLYMSLVGIRDTSLLETPPLNRFPVQTYVLEEDPVIIREAINRELARGGQVYFVHNRVQDLEEVAAWVQSLAPEARLAVAHGQMDEEELERVMLDFVAGKYDILVCTTIIEAGLDIGNVNTLIVKNADQFGLAQLYQLRGRVGRSNRLAYAYFTFSRDRVLNEAAEKRLEAIRDFTDFGAGFKIAKRDLEIRGAGNLLGTEQHGHIAAVGFDLYCRLMAEAVREMRGEAPEETVETVVELPVTAYLPSDYVHDGDQKVRLYYALAGARDPAQVEDLRGELVDRFGTPPAAVENLLAVSRLRALGKKLKVKSISRQGKFYRIIFAPGHPLTGEKLVGVAQKFPRKLKFREEDGTFEIWMEAGRTGRADGEAIMEIEAFLANMA
ncbi:MAG: transcription-repair coupling factor [Bacillota bacterium]